MPPWPLGKSAGPQTTPWETSLTRSRAIAGAPVTSAALIVAPMWGHIALKRCPNAACVLQARDSPRRGEVLKGVRPVLPSMLIQTRRKRLLEDLVAEVPSDRRSTCNLSGLDHFAVADKKPHLSLALQADRPPPVAERDAARELALGGLISMAVLASWRPGPSAARRPQWEARTAFPQDPAAPFAVG
jgi:hypothetical protein